MFEEHKEKLVWHIVIGCDPSVFLTKVMTKLRFEIDRSGGKNYLVAVDRFSLNHQCYVAKLLLI